VPERYNDGSLFDKGAEGWFVVFDAYLRAAYGMPFLTAYFKDPSVVPPCDRDRHFGPFETRGLATAAGAKIEEGRPDAIAAAIRRHEIRLIDRFIRKGLRYRWPL